MQRKNAQVQAGHDRTRRVWDIIERIGVCMLTTQFSGGLRARPVEARVDGSGYNHSRRRDQGALANDRHRLVARRTDGCGSKAVAHRAVDGGTLGWSSEHRA